MSMRTLLRNGLLVLGMIFSLNVLANDKCSSDSNDKDWPIIVRKGDKLYEGDKVFRFLSFAVPNIQQNESQIRTDRTNRFPDEYEVRDILDALQRLGGRATRTFSLSILSPEDDNMPVYVQGKRDYNEEAFQCLDRILAYAPEYDVRIIIPFIASQRFGGIRGVDEFAALSGKAEVGAFWTDPEVKADFKHFLSFILNRTNTITGKPYKTDPAILGWQFGNEFDSYYGDRRLPGNEWRPIITAWCQGMGAFIKQNDPNHLLFDGGGMTRQAVLADPNIDVVSEHLYEYWSDMGTQLSPIALRSMEECKGIKPLVIDEFGLCTMDNLKTLLETIRETDITGGLLWSVRGHRRDGGWYYHNEGGTSVNSFHYPGFSAGRVYDEKRTLDLMRTEAYLLKGEALPAIKAPSQAPVLFAHKDGFTWRGSTGASYYVIERSESPEGQWKVLATGLEDSVIADVIAFEYSPEAAEPLVFYHDETKDKNKKYYYRLKGVNEGGSSEYSNILAQE